MGANTAAQALQALKQQFEEQESARKPGLQVASPVAAEAPAVAPPTAAVAPPLGAISKEDVQQAEKDARLYVWAARTLAAKGAPQMDMMQAKADNAALALRSLKLKFEEQEAARKPTMGVFAPSTPAVAPPAAVSPAAASSTSVSSSMLSVEEVAAAKKTADLQAWAAKTLAAKGLPEAAPCRSRLPRVPRSMRNLRLHVNSWTPAECWLPVEWQIFILQFSEWLPASVETPQQGRL